MGRHVYGVVYIHDLVRALVHGMHHDREMDHARVSVYTTS